MSERSERRARGLPPAKETAEDPGVAVIRQLFGEVRDAFLTEMREYEKSLRDSFLKSLDERNETLINAVNKAIADAVRINTEHAQLKKKIDDQEISIALLQERVSSFEKYEPLLELLQKLHK